MGQRLKTLSGSAAGGRGGKGDLPPFFRASERGGPKGGQCLDFPAKLEHLAKRGLDSISTGDTRYLRDEFPKAHKVFRAVALRGGLLARTAAHLPARLYCDKPVLLGFRHRGGNFNGKRLKAVECSLYGPCRKCAKCLQFRQMRWRERALREIASAKRTWFVTLTFSPVHLAGVLLKAVKFAGLDPAKAQERCAYEDVQLYWKRLRKRGFSFRFLAVFERGEKTGRAHYHALIHEMGQRPIPKSVLEEEWRSHVHARLVADKARGAAGYITKYATKSLAVKPRASLHYGKVKVSGSKTAERFPTLGGKNLTPKALGSRGMVPAPQSVGTSLNNGVMNVDLLGDLSDCARDGAREVVLDRAESQISFSDDARFETGRGSERRQEATEAAAEPVGRVF